MTIQENKGLILNICPDPPSPTLSLEEGDDDDDDSAFSSTISDVTGTSVATCSTYGASIATSGLGIDISDVSKVTSK